MHAETVKIVKSPELSGQLLTLGAEPVGNTPQELSRFIKAQIDRWTKLVAAANIRVD
ncbi:Tripartite tricarboxylate transporter family receptor [compost metagenome]